MGGSGLVLLVGLVACMWGTALSFPHGGSANVCPDPFPHHHGVASQTSVCPFELTTSSKNYSSGDNITVYIRLRQGAAAESHFIGFQVSAHSVRGRWDDLQGEFTLPPADAKVHYFFSDRGNCLTHSATRSRTSLQFVWRAPKASVGDIVFSATIMSKFEIFWVNVSTQILSNEVFQKDSLAARIEISQKPSSQAPFDKCGHTQTCLLWPGTCSDPDKCRAVVAYGPAAEPGYVKFQMAGFTDGYLSLGLSLDKKMANDETLTCLVQQSGQLMFQRGYNPGYHNNRVTEELVKNISMHYENGKLYCEFVRPLMAYVNLTTSRKTVLHPFDLSVNGKYYLYLAWGSLYPGSYDSIMYHEQLPVVAPDTMNLSNPRKYHFASLPVELQVHITLMLIAWLGLSSIGTVVARYFRSGIFDTTKINGKVAWLQVHRGTLVAALLPMAFAFAIPFVYVQGWSEVATLHAAFGVGVVALTVLQSIAAACRPRPTSGRRKAFAWLHRLFGVLAWTGAAACTVLGVNISYMPPEVAKWGTAVVAAWIASQIIVCIALEIMQRAATTGAPSSDIGGMKIEEKESADGSRVAHRHKSRVFVLYSIIIVVLLGTSLGIIWWY